MSIVNDIKNKRTAGIVRCGYVAQASSLLEVVSFFSLSTDLSIYRKITKTEAIKILIRILHKDMAYDSEIMPAHAAAELCASFLQDFADESTAFFTNIDYSAEGKAGNNTWVGPNWKPVTTATFDAGVIAVSELQSACLWIEDED